MFVYILRLECDKWFISHTSKENFNVQDLVTDLEWLVRYPPVELIECVVGDTFEENKQTIKYMQKYGIQNVRGGIHTACTLHTGAIRQIKKQIWQAEGACARCGRRTHGSDCLENTTVDGDVLFTNVASNVVATCCLF